MESKRAGKGKGNSDSEIRGFFAALRMTTVGVAYDIQPAAAVVFIC
jgi:hypothetical protein